ncbi:polysaccharide deacetylase family protein [Devosia geojensis]|uniref:polysaccharide deacetylase family protein n=1 Tax=Devosia geojensis TaxID=443610 RepID=UPI000697EB25|nr:polysaccharide deacetylase family protein [Devosia geojensis]
MANAFQDIGAGLSRRLARNLPFRPARWRLDAPVVAFTFDDFPASAADNAAPILEDAGMRGTFYLATGLVGSAENGQPIAGLDRVEALAAAGHEIGAHTHGHIDVQRAPDSALIADVEINGLLIAEAAGAAPASFAYPYGIVSLRAKQTLMHRYAGLRGIAGGINRGVFDLAHLRAEELYDSTSSPASIEALLDGLERLGGWLIFYTHDVRPEPTGIGCSPAHFAQTVAAVRRRGIRVEPVATTLRRIGAAGAAP